MRPLAPLAALLLLAPHPASQAERAPNIVLIMVDDLGWADLGCYGGSAVPTPQLDRLAAQGMRFTDAYSGCTVCAPARSTLLTGTHMGHTSMRLNTGGVPILDEDVTVAEVLREAGYRTGGFGKWGLGELGTAGVPERQGFDEWYGYYHQIHAHYHLPDYLIRNGAKEPLPGNAGFYELHPHGREGDGAFPPSEGELERQYAPELIVEETLRFLRESARSEQPFFCYAAWTPPHGEYKVPADDPGWLEYGAREDWPVRARVVASFTARIDRDVGRVLALLDELDIADETLVLYTHDHGADLDYDGALDSCGPLRGHKRDLYEGGLRVPLIARWPGRIAPGSVSDLATYFPDLLPTLAELAGCRAPAGIDGLSIAPTLLGSGEQALHAYLYWEWARYDWGRRTLVEGGLMQALRSGRWKAVRTRADAALELYDLHSDLGEQNDLAQQQPERVAHFEALLDAARTPMRPQAEPERVEGRPFR